METPAPTAAGTASKPIDPRNRSIIAIAVGFLGLGFLAITDFWSLKTSYVLDDYFLCGAEGGLATVWGEFWSLTGLYRPLTYPVTAFRFFTCDAFWIHKVVGLMLHTAVAGALWRFGRKAGLGIPTAFLSAAIFVFSPFALEAVAWPAVVYGYPLAALLLILYGSSLLSQSRIGTASVLGVLAIMANEQTLAIVVALPLLLNGADRRRIRRFAIVAGPALSFFAVTVFSGYLSGYQRAAASGPQGIMALAENLMDDPGTLTWILPASEPWLAFADGGSARPNALVWPAVMFATIAAYFGHRLDQPRPLTNRYLLKGAWALLGACALLLPFYAQDPLFLSPRYFYLPYLGVSLGLGFLAESLLLKFPRASFVVLLVPLATIWVVGDGLRADSTAYQLTFAKETATAKAIAETMADTPGATQLILVDSPWTFTPDRPLLGHHIVQAFSIGWAAPGAVRVLADNDFSIRVLVDLGGTEICHRDGIVLVGGEEQLNRPTDTIFSVLGQGPVGQLNVDDQKMVIAERGIDYAVLPCTRP